mgnify:FL=1
MTISVIVLKLACKNLFCWFDEESESLFDEMMIVALILSNVARFRCYNDDYLMYYQLSNQLKIGTYNLISYFKS